MDLGGIPMHELDSLAGCIVRRRVECMTMDYLTKKFDSLYEEQKVWLDIFGPDRNRRCLNRLMLGISTSMFFMNITYLLYKKTNRLVNDSL